MKKIGLIIIIFVVFLLGINVGNNKSKQSVLFEEAKDNFELEIVKPDNNYEEKQLAPNQSFVNKIANKIDNIIKTISDKIV